MTVLLYHWVRADVKKTDGAGKYASHIGKRLYDFLSADRESPGSRRNERHHRLPDRFPEPVSERSRNMEGPRAVRREEFPTLRRLTDAVFRPGMIDEYPQLF